MPALSRRLVQFAGLAAAALFAVQAPAQAQPAPRPSVLGQPQVDIGSAIAMPDIVYSRLPGFRPLRLDVYKPKGANKPLPLVIYFHGGGWAGGDPRGAPFSAADGPAWYGDLAAHGYVVASATYRFVNEAKFPAQEQDARAAIRYLRANAAQYGIDPSQVIIMGGSAGGYLATLTALSCGDASLDAPARPGPGGATPAPPPPGSECVQGVVDYYPVTDLVSLSRYANPTGAPYASAQGILGAFLGCAPASCPPAAVQQADVVGRITPRSPPFLIVHGDADTTVPIGESQKFDAALKAKGVSSTFIVIPGASHTFPQVKDDAIRPYTQQIYAWLDSHTHH